VFQVFSASVQVLARGVLIIDRASDAWRALLGPPGPSDGPSRYRDPRPVTVVKSFPSNAVVIRYRSTEPATQLETGMAEEELRLEVQIEVGSWHASPMMVAKVT
jgi:hypothetical protein